MEIQWESVLISSQILIWDIRATSSKCSTFPRSGNDWETLSSPPMRRAKCGDTVGWHLFVCLGFFYIITCHSSSGNNARSCPGFPSPHIGKRNMSERWQNDPCPKLCSQQVHNQHLQMPNRNGSSVFSLFHIYICAPKTEALAFLILHDAGLDRRSLAFYT